MPKLACSILLLFCAFVAIGQPARQYSFTHYTTETGLLSNQVNGILQDEAGFIWIATNDGLVRYDGIRYKSFRTNEKDPFALPSNQVSQLIQDKNKQLWLLMTNGRTGRFDTKRFTFHEAKVTPNSELSFNASYKKLITDEFGHVFLLLTGNEVLTWDSTLDEFSASHNFISYRKDWKINDLIQQPGTRKYWLGIEGGGFAVYNHASQNLSYAGQNLEAEPAVEHFKNLVNVSEFLFDKKQRLWFRTYDAKYSYVYCYDFDAKQPFIENYDFISTFKSHYRIEGFFTQQDGTVWLRGFKAFGYFKESAREFVLIPTKEGSLDYRVISALFEDRERNMWVGTGNNGLFLFNPSMGYFANISHISRETGEEGYGSPISFAAEKNGAILVGMWRDGLYRYDKNLNAIPLDIEGISENNLLAIHDMYPSGDSNTIWLSSHPGIYAFDQKNRKATHYDPEIMQQRAIRRITEDRNGDLWLAVQGLGLFKWKATTGRKKFEEGLLKFTHIPSVEVNDLRTDKKGQVWVATVASGIYVINPDADTIVMHLHSEGEPPYKLPEENAAAVFEYSDSIMVIATTRQILLYNTSLKKMSLLTSDQVISGDISSIQKDSKGYLWVSTTAAIYRVNIKTRVFIAFDRHDGIPNDYFVLSSSCVLPDGRLLFGASAHIVAFNPSEVSISTAFPDITITDFKVMNKSLRVDSLMQLEEIELDHDENSLELDFSTLTYNSSYVILYKMEGIDQDWKIADKSNQAVYSYLLPGDYVLLFNTIDAEGNRGRKAMKLAIHIEPPFWQTWWFYSIVALLASAMLYWLDRQRIQTMRREHQMRMAIATNLHQDVNTSLRDINVLSEIASMKSGSQPEQARDYLKEIQHKSRNIVIAMNDVLWSIDPDNDSMPKTIDRMQEVADSMLSRHDGTVEVQSTDSVRKMRMNAKKRLEFIIIYKLVLSMLIDQLKSVELTVQLDCCKGMLQLKIFSMDVALPKADTVITAYMEEIKTRAAAINSTVDIETDAKGVGFMLEVRA